MIASASNVIRMLLFSLGLLGALFLGSAFAHASTESLDWTNFSYRVANLIIVIAIVYYFFGKKIQCFFSTRRGAIIAEMQELEKRKNNALHALVLVEEQMKRLESDRSALLFKYEEEAEMLHDEIIAKAHEQAQGILTHAKILAENEIVRVRQEVLESVANSIIVEVQNAVSAKEVQHAFVQKSIEKVVELEKELNCKTLC